MDLDGCNIAVAGAGIGGLAAAIALAQRRAKVRVFERAEALEDVGAGIQVGPNGVAVLEALGLRDAAEKCAALPEAIELRDFSTERTVAKLPLGQHCVSRYGRPYWQFHRADLLAVLEAGAREAGVEIVFGAPVTDVSQSETGCHLRYGQGGQWDAAAVICADGVRSELRAGCFGGHEAEFSGHVAWRGLVDMAKLPEGLFPPGACVTMGPGRHVVTYPLRGHTLMNFVAIEERSQWVAEGWSQKDDVESLRAAFAGWSGAVETLLNAVDETWLWGLFAHPPLKTWVNGRMALLGDACHPMLPFLAQGATMGLEDAWVLAAELDVADDINRGLQAYEFRRKSRTTRVQKTASRSGWIYHLGPGRRELAHIGLAAMSALAPGQLLGRFDWLYGADVVSAEATA